MNKWCVMCSEVGTIVDEVTGNRFCQLHAGPLGWDALTVDRYSLALRIGAYTDMPVALPGSRAA